MDGDTIPCHHHNSIGGIEKWIINDTITCHHHNNIAD